MTVYPLRTALSAALTPGDSDEAEVSALPAWGLAAALLCLFALTMLASIEPFRYPGVGRHLTASVAFAAYILGWKEIFRRYLAS